jgi:hypothetical protein
VSGRLAVRDGRASSVIVIDCHELALLNERVERRYQSQARSVYLALVEAGGKPEGWSRKSLAERAGVGVPIVSRTIESLTELGIVRVGDDGAIWLGSLTVPREPLAVVDPGLVAGPVVAGPVASERAERFFEFYAGRIGDVVGERPPRGREQLRAADRILGIESDSTQIRARLEFALGHRFYADKVLTMKRFAEWFARISAAYKAQEVTDARSRQDRPEVAPARRVSYESERVQVVA